MSDTTQVYRIYIKASAQAIWDAITRPEWTERYGYTGLVDYDLRPGKTFTSERRAAQPESGAAAPPFGEHAAQSLLDQCAERRAFARRHASRLVQGGVGEFNRGFHSDMGVWVLSAILPYRCTRRLPGVT